MCNLGEIIQKNTYFLPWVLFEQDICDESNEFKKKRNHFQ